MGVPMRVAMATIIRLPKMALISPPLLPGGGVVCVKTDMLSPGSPCSRSVHKIHPSQNKPNSMASTEMPKPRELMMRRRK